MRKIVSYIAGSFHAMKCRAQRKTSLFVIASTLSTVGCAMEMEEPYDVGVNVEPLFSSSFFLPDNGLVERSASCGTDEVMTGFCGRVDERSNFTHVSVTCRLVDAVNGTLGNPQVRGDTSCGELSVTADDGWVAVGAAGSVANNNLNLAAVRQCQWLPASKRVWVSNSSETCQWKRHDGTKTFSQTISAEKLTDSHAGVSIATRQTRVLVGIGLTASSDEAMGKVRISVGNLQ